MYAYRRTINIFSPTGAFSIEIGHDDESGDKLLLSYHDNGHYNSVRDENTAIKPITNGSTAAHTARDVSSANNGGKKKKKKKRDKANSLRMDGDEEEKKDGGELEVAEATNDESREEDSSKRIGESEGPVNDAADNDSKRQLVLRKNDPCPCGSGLRYKKCCLATEKSRVRAAKWKEKHVEAGAEEENDGDAGKELDGTFKELDGTFKVLKI